VNNKGNAIRKDIEDRLLDPYDKSVVDLHTVAAVIRVALMQEYMWQTYYRLIAAGWPPDTEKVFMRLGEDEQRHQDSMTCLSDRTETSLEKTVAMQAAYIARLAEFSVNEPDGDIRTSFEYILADHLTHHRQFSHKLTQKEGLSPMARALFTGRPGREIDEQFIEIEAAPKPHYNRKSAAPLTKAQVRLALASELAQREAYRAMAALSSDKHLVIFYQQASIVDNRHIAILRSLIDPTETRLESAYLAELAEVVDLENAVALVPAGRINDVLRGLLDEDRLHLQVVGGLLVESGGPESEEAAKPIPELKAVAGLDGVVEAIAENSPSIVSRAGCWRRAA
jgi:rubrerythrin